MAKDLGFKGIEMRGLGDDIFSVKAKPFCPENIDKTVEQLGNRHLEIPCLSSGCALKYAEKAEELQKQLDDLNNQNLSEVEKANKERDDALNSVTTLQNQIKAMELKTKFAEKGIVGEQADRLLESLNGGSFDVDILGQIISDRETMAAQAKEKEIAKGSSNPGGGTDDNNPDANKPEDVKNAEAITFGAVSQKEDVVNYYKK